MAVCIFAMLGNFPIQSTASDINLYCMLHLYKNRDKFGISPMFPVHDSVVMTVQDKELIPSIVQEVETYCEDLVDGKMVFKTDTAVGRNWGNMVKM